MSPLAIGLIVLALLVIVYFLVLKKPKIARIKLYKPKELVDKQAADDSTYQVAQVVLFDHAGQALKPADVVATTGDLCYGTKASTAFDGNTSNQNYPHVFHSCAKNYNNFLQAKLNTPQELSMIKVYNRTDCCSDRLNGVVLELYDDSDKLVDSFVLTSKLINIVDLDKRTVS